MKLRGRRFQFSIASLLVLMVVLAALLSVWDYFTFEPYSHRFSLYEKADGTFSDSIEIGPNVVRVGLVSRNDRNGTILHEDGRGGAVPNRTAQNEKELVDVAPWLDVVQIELAPVPDRLDIIEARIFELPSHQPISDVDHAYGWRVTDPEVIQIFGLGKKLPPKVDVWLRLQSYDPRDMPVKLAPAVGSTCSLPGGTIELVDIRDGYWGYSGGTALNPLLRSGGEDTSLVIQWKGKWQDTDYQIAAVSKTGQKSHSEMFHFLRFGRRTENRPIHFEFPLAEIDHFELRPFGGRHRFFFGAVELPGSPNSAFGSPPTVTVKVGGREMEAAIAELGPLDVRVRTRRGEWADGVMSRNGRGSITALKGDATNVEQVFTFDYRHNGMAVPHFRFQRKSAGVFEDESVLKPSSSLTAGSVGYREYSTPLEEVEAVEVTIKPK